VQTKETAFHTERVEFAFHTERVESEWCLSWKVKKDIEEGKELLAFISSIDVSATDSSTKDKHEHVDVNVERRPIPQCNHSHLRKPCFPARTNDFK
jgi:hypothetical protein